MYCSRMKQVSSCAMFDVSVAELNLANRWVGDEREEKPGGMRQVGREVKGMWLHLPSLMQCKSLWVPLH